jgi:hypothetical protein
MVRASSETLVAWAREASNFPMPTALDNGQRSLSKLLAVDWRNTLN